MERATASPDAPPRRSGGPAGSRRGASARVGTFLGALAVGVAMAAGLVASSVALVGPAAAATPASKGSAATPGSTSTAPASGRAKSNASGSGTVKSFTPASTDRVTFGIEPASASGPDGRSYFTFGSTPGGVLGDDVAVVNYSKVPLSLELDATDAVETSGGGFGLLQPGVKPTGAGSWITLQPGTTTVAVPAESTSGTPGWTVVPFTVHVPFEVSPGDHVGGIVASLRTVGTNAAHQRTVLYQRIGTRVFVQVTGRVAPKLTVDDLHATYQGAVNPFGRGSVRVTYDLRNTGNMDLAVTQSVAVSPVVGSDRQVSVPKIPLLLPGGSVTETAVLTGLWPQILLHATVTAHWSVPPGSGAPRSGTVTTGTGVPAVPWPLAVVVVVLVAIVLLGRRYRRRSRAGRGAKGAGPGSGGGDASGDAGPTAAARGARRDDPVKAGA